MLKNLSRCLLAAVMMNWTLPAMAGDLSKEEFGNQVREYLLQNPEVLMEALRVLEERQKVTKAQSLIETLASARKDLDNDGYSYVAGNENGDVTVIEFFDYRCGYCKHVMPDVKKLVDNDTKVRLVLKEFPVLGVDSTYAARAAIASIKQGAYQSFHDAMMENRGPLPQAKVLSIAEGLGMDIDRLQRDMKDPEVEKVIQANLDLGRSLGITGTPSFIIGDEVIPGAVPYRHLTSSVAKTRAECKTC